VRPETGEPIRIVEPLGFSHPEIMPSFLAPRNAKNLGKTGPESLQLTPLYPLTLEKSRIILLNSTPGRALFPAVYAGFIPGCRILRAMDGDDLKIYQIIPVGSPLLE
jgi:hypothetical protein